MHTTDQVNIFENKKPKLHQELGQIIRVYPALIWNLAIRELKVKYAQTILGFFWSIIRPLSFLAIYTFFFTIMLDVDTEGMPYALAALAGIIGWYYFSDIVTTAGQSLIMDAHIIKKHAFPKLIFPFYRSLIGLLELLISLVIFFGIQLFLGHPFHIYVVLLPLVILLNMMIGLAVALWTSALSIRVRDVFHLVRTFLNFGMWLTPVFYLPNLIPDGFEYLLYLNPMAGVIALYRWVLLGGSFPEWQYVIGLSIGLFFFISGLKAFVNSQDKAADFL